MNERWKVSKITKKNIKSIKRYMTKQKVLRFIKMTFLVIGITLILLSLLGTVAQAAGLVDDTVSAENLYSKYPLQNYTLDFDGSSHKRRVVLLFQSVPHSLSADFL